jgi:hypothetical protein
MKKTFPLIIFLVVIISSCEFPEMKPLKLKKDFLSLQSELKNPGGFESVGITNNSNTRNGTTRNTIELNLVNGKELPADENALNTLIKSKAKIIADQLENKKDYLYIKVKLESNSQNGIVSKSITRDFTFYFDELEEENPAQPDSLKADSVQITPAQLD